ncbi:DNA polymerase III subunit gamma/tau [Aurantivibrio plasticivorans]
MLVAVYCAVIVNVVNQVTKRMSYQVLARKWRPRVFREMVGQEHVLKALINALDHNRLHHAYLFTGTRGVGKTTIARILAKCLNCEAGVSSEPCDQCGACLEINEGRFVDLIEVDAASRTKVEDTRELLDNVQYAPSKGRYKVYLIDEVHMLSGHSFNALLKTLEEPPPHVKFLLATTDPQKLPVTILSRCLQFNLKNMAPERIVEHLAHILEREMIPFEESALWQLGRSADGSMRDALSLTDQAIGFGNGKVTEADVSAMLGAIDQRYLYEILTALAANDGEQLLQRVAHMAEQSPDYADVLASMISLLHRIAIAQVLPEAVDNTFGDRDEILQIAQQLPGEDVQLFYQTALLGRRDLNLVPDPRGGFEMVLLRMLAFRPQGVLAAPSQPLPQKKQLAEPSTQNHSNVQAVPVTQSVQPARESENPVPAGNIQEGSPEKKPIATSVPPAEPRPARSVALSTQSSPPTKEHVTVSVKRLTDEAKANSKPTAPSEAQNAESNAKSVEESAITFDDLTPELWPSIAAKIPVGGVIQNTLVNCQLLKREAGHLHFRLDENNSTLYDDSHQQRFSELFSKFFAKPIEVSIELGVVDSETPALRSQRQREERQQEALVSFKNDPIVVDVMNTFAGTVRDETIIPIDPMK